MLALLWKTSTSLRGCLRSYMPTNRVVDWLRTPGGTVWAIPVAVVAVPAYLFAMSICATLVERGGPGYLNCLVAAFTWNSIKFAVLGLWALVRTLPMWLARSGDHSTSGREPCGPRPETLSQEACRRSIIGG